MDRNGRLLWGRVVHVAIAMGMVVLGLRIEICGGHGGGSVFEMLTTPELYLSPLVLVVLPMGVGVSCVAIDGLLSLKKVRVEAGVLGLVCYGVGLVVVIGFSGWSAGWAGLAWVSYVVLVLFEVRWTVREEQ